MVNRIRRNVLPLISNLALQNPKTIYDLFKISIQFEEPRIWSDRYQSPPNPKNRLLEPDLTCP